MLSVTAMLDFSGKANRPTSIHGLREDVTARAYTCASIVFLRHVDIHHNELIFLHFSAQEVVTCESSTMTLTCAVSSLIRIDSAMYGHYDHQHCGGPLSGTNCHLVGDFSIVDGLCSGEQTCDITANNALFGDPCPGTLEYLQVHYTCLFISESTF